MKRNTKLAIASAIKKIVEIVFLTAIGALMAYVFLGASGLFDRI